jgi:iron-sulfur cluster assembly accessory protein
VRMPVVLRLCPPVLHVPAVAHSRQASTVSAADDLGLGPLIVTPAAVEVGGRCASLVRACARWFCLQHYDRMKKKRKAERLWLRVQVDAGGCGGFQYLFNFEEEGPREGDVEVVKGSAHVLIDAASLEKMRGSTIDYEVSMMEAVLTVKANPNAESGCGCGSSFALKGDSF